MESFQAKISWERLGKREKNKNRSNYFLPDPKQKIKKKLKNTIVASFEAKISWGRPRKRENKKRKKSFL